VSATRRYNRRVIRRVPRSVSLVVVAVLAGGAGPLATRAQTDAALAPGTTVRARLDAAALHRHVVDAPAGALVTVRVAQTGADLSVNVTGAQLAAAIVFNDTSRESDELVRFVAPAAGRYTLEVRRVAEDDEAPGDGAYEMVLEAMAPATPAERDRVAEVDRARARQREAIAGIEPLLLMQTAPQAEGTRLATELGALAAFWLEEQRPHLAVDAITYHARIVTNVFEDLDASKVLLATALAMPATKLQRAILLNDLAIVEDRLGEMVTAVEHLEEALELGRRTGHVANVAIQASNLGLAHQRLGRYERAMELKVEAVDVFRRLGMHDHEALALSDLAGVWEYLGEFDTALDVQRQAVAVAREAKSPLAVAVATGNLGRRLQRRGQHGDVRGPVQEALDLAVSLGNRRIESAMTAALARLDIDLGQPAAALESATRAMSLATSIRNPVSEAVAWQVRAEALHARQQYAEASTAYEEARTRFAAAQLAPELAEVLRLQGRLAVDMGDLALAEQRLQAAITTGESARVRLLAPDARATHAATRDRAFADYVDVRLQRHRLSPASGHAAAAVEAVERMRARGLLDLLAEARADVGAEGDPALLARGRQLRDALDAKDQALTAAQSRPRASALVATLQTELNDLASELRVVEGQLRATSPRYAALTAPTPRTARDIQSRILDDQTVLLQYVFGETRSWVIAVTPASIDATPLAPRSEIETAARAAAAAFSRAAHTAGARRSRDAALRRLSDLVLAPLGDTLETVWRGKRLAVMSTGALEYVPLAGLPAPGVATTSPLGDRHEIVSLPSASVLDDLRQLAAARPPAARAVAVVADPVFTADDPRVSVRPGANLPPGHAAPRARLALGRLPFTRDEAAAIRALAPSGQVFSALGFEATRELVTGGTLAGHRIVHIATHGVLNTERPDLSGLTLSMVGKDGRGRDGFLRADAIYNVKLDADLVVLSACQTALGRTIRGEGLTGMTRAWMYAGAPRVVASLWRVDDAASAELMRRFYRGLLRQHLAPAAALSAAQRAMAATPAWRDPYYWAGFILQGDWR